MPIYEYECGLCEIVFEEHHPMSEATAPRKCPNCKDGIGRRIFSKHNFHSKELPKGHNLSATQRRKAWNSNDPKEFRKIM